MLITGIHGAFCSPRSFNYVNEKSKHVWQFADYSDKRNGIENITKDLKTKLNEETIIVGHSLGGVMATLLLQHKNVKGIITISSPLGGIRLNGVMAMYMSKNFISELKVSGKVVRNVKNILDITDKPVYHIITNNGFNPFLNNENDGVVEVKSQTSSPHPKLFLPFSHNEVMTTHELTKNLDIMIERII